MPRIIILLLIILVLGCNTTSHIEDTISTNLLTNHKYKNLIIEIITIKDFKITPATDSLEFIQEKLKKHIHKDTITFQTNELNIINTTFAWNVDSLIYFKNKHKLYVSKSDTIVIHILYLPGFSSRQASVRGEYFDDNAIVIYRNNFGQDHERAVLLHELFHNIGLVDNGVIPRSRHVETDEKHLKHCSNEDCVMYWSAPTVPNPDICRDCKADIVFAGGKR